MQEIFVFGSNLRGIHGAGAAVFAVRHHGAIMGQGMGLQGNSYALPTKDHRIQTLPLQDIGRHVAAFLEFTKIRPDLLFNVTRVGCGLAGYTDEQVAPLFINAVHGRLTNIRLPQGWRELILTGKRGRISDEFEDAVPQFTHA